jgi:photosystem II stability/assembly factor-like uncharacterized protein
MRGFRIAIVCLLSLIALQTFPEMGSSTVWAGNNKWTSIGPFNGAVQGLAIDPQNPSTIYAGAGNGVFKSTDGGASWYRVNSGILSVSTLVIDPQTPSIVYAGSLGGGVFKSMDGGANWSSASAGLRTFVGVLAIDPQNPNTLYAGTEGGVFKSGNGGTSWYLASSGLPTQTNGPSAAFLQVTLLAIDPQNPDTVYAVSALPTDVDGRALCCSSGIFKSTNGGASWSDLTLPSGLSFRVSSLVIDPQNPNTIYAARASTLFKSTDGGTSWYAVNSAIAVSTLAIDSHSPNTLYAGTTNGLFKSRDGGENWTTVNSRLPASPVGLVLDPQNSSTMYAEIGRAGLFKSRDGGENWTTVNSGLSTVLVLSLAVDPQNPSTVYAAADGGIFKSTDAGSNWSAVNTGLPNSYYFIGILAIDPQNPRTIYAGTWGEIWGEFRDPVGIFKSTDGGTSWSAASFGLPGNLSGIGFLVIDPHNPNTVYAETDQGVFKSSDGAASWNAANSGLRGNHISTLVFDPRTPGTLYAGGSGGVSKSTDDGVSWNAANSGLPTNRAVMVLAIDPQNPSTVYAGNSDSNLFKSTDGGTSWSAASSGLPSNSNWIGGLVIDPQNPSTVYVGTSGAFIDGCSFPCSGLDDGVFKSTDGGATWTPVNSGLTTPHVSSLVIDPQDPSRLYAGTIGGGVFAITFGLAPVVTDLRFDRPSVVAGTSFSVNVSGSNLTPQTFFDVRFTAPGSNASDVILNWQRGVAASHGVATGTALGIWTINGVRAHQDETDHTGSFVSVSATITVSP